MKSLIYSCYTQGYDEDVSHVVDVNRFIAKDRFLGSNLNAKVYKVFPFEFFEYDVCIWIDGNIEIIDKDFENYMLNQLGDYEMMTLNVKGRGCISEEVVEIRKNPTYGKYELEKQVDRYFKSGFPTGFGINGNGIMVRKNTDNIRRLMLEWWKEITIWSVRDQLSLPFCVWKLGLKDKVKILDIDNVRDKYVLWKKHL